MYRGLTIHLQGPSRAALGTHLTYMGHARTRSVISTCIGVDTMVGSQTRWKSTAITPDLFRSITTHISPVVFGMDLITAMVLLLLRPPTQQCSL